MGNFRVMVSHFDPGSLQNYTSPLTNIPPSSSGSGNSKTNAFSPAVVAVIGVLAGAFLIVSYYRIFAKYCTRFRLPFWGFGINDRDDSPSALVMMEEQIWPPNAMGLEEALINRIPMCTYRHQDGLIEDAGCSVCLSEFEEEETLRILPKCNHAFHVQCIDTWLNSHSTCPLCRVNIVLAAGLPYALMPIDRQLSSERFSMSLIDEEIQVLQEQLLQELLQEQVSAASHLNSLPSGRSSFHTAPDVESSEEAQAQQIESEEEITQHERPSSPVTDTQIPIKEIHMLSSSNVTIHETSKLTSQASISGKKRLYSRARSDRHRRRESTERGRTSSKGSKEKGKHPVVSIPSPQMKRNRLSRMVRSHSASSTSSSSSNQIVIELLAQEIFKENVVSRQDRGKNPGSSLDTSAIFETSVRKLGRFSAPKGTTSSEGSSSGSPHVTPDFRAPGTLKCRDEDIVINVEELLEREETPWHLDLPRDEDGRSDHEGAHEFRRSCKSFKGPVMGQPKHCQTWPHKSRSMKTFRSMKLKRCGSGGPTTVKLSSFRSSQKVHASEPVFEIFDFS